jgi:hypothetical protein
MARLGLSLILSRVHSSGYLFAGFLFELGDAQALSDLKSLVGALDSALESSTIFLHLHTWVVHGCESTGFERKVKIFTTA